VPHTILLTTRTRSSLVSDPFYNLTVLVCKPAFTISSSPIVLHADRIPRRDACIIAPTHLSAFDVPCLMAITPRNFDFVSIVELFRKPLLATFFRKMNAFPLDRGRVDPATTRIIFDRLNNRRAVVMFPEGHLRAPAQSVLAGGPFKPSLIRIAQLANVPIIPTVILGTSAYKTLSAWYPLRNTRYAVNFGEPIQVPSNIDTTTAANELRKSWHKLHLELRSHPQFPRTAASADSDEIVRAAAFSH
jgi:1-acyl-sn-glycerol-3-phosphate acyltransferase